MKWPVYGIHPHNLDEPCSSYCLSMEGTGPRPLCNYGHTEEDHERVGACERPGLANRLTTGAITYETTEINRPAVELMFDLCTICKERRNCTCHDEGKGMS